MNLRGKETTIMLAIAVLWLVITYLGWIGSWLTAMFLGIGLMLLHMVLGSMRKGRLAGRFFLYPLLLWAALWGIGFYLSYIHALMFKGIMPSFTILGFHPSFAWTVLTYWIGGMLTLGLGFVVCKDAWLSAEDWSEFKKKIEILNDAKGGPMQ